MKEWIRNIFKRKPLHDRELYVLENGLAFVKCKRCGQESIPWEVNKKEAVAFNERHPESMKELLEVDKNKVSDGVS